ncbi:MAG: hypothetical protein IPL55_00330 [Saprospiraceae bacterium]|nr:hypothetical protein [Saprospiraceae bacterium]
MIYNRATIQSPDLKEKGHFGQAISATKDDLFISESGALNAPMAGVVYKYDLNNIVNRNVPTEIIRSSDYIGNDGFGLVTSGEDSLLAVSSPYHYRFGGLINGNTEILEYPQVELFKKNNNAYQSLGIIKDPQANQWTFGHHLIFDENKLYIQRKWQPSFYSKGRYYEYQLADNRFSFNQVFRLTAPYSDTTYSLIKGEIRFLHLIFPMIQDLYLFFKRRFKKLSL